MLLTFGHIAMALTTMAEFKFRNNIITHIVPVSANECIVKIIDHDNKLFLLNHKGELTRTIELGPFSCFRFVYSLVSDELIFVNMIDKSVNKLQLEKPDNIQTMFSTRPNFPSLICNSNDCGFTLVSEKCNTEQTRYVFQKYSKNGERKALKMPNPETEKDLGYLMGIAELSNGKICAISRQENCNSVLILDANLNIINVYQGQGEAKKQFDPLGLCCDMDSIYVSDSHNHVIHRISTDAEFIEFLDIPNLHFPGPLAISPYGGTLAIWIGCEDSSIRVCKLRQTYT